MANGSRVYGHLFIFILCFSVYAAASDANVDVGKSSLIATFRQDNVPVDAPFRRFTGTILYDPANVTAATAALDVETGSLDIGDESYNAEVRKPHWFDSNTFPTATFRSKTITATSTDTLECVGTLTIKGRSQTFKLPIHIKKTPTGAAFDGTLEVSRKIFGIGGADWDEVLEDKVSIKFHIMNIR
jgi:polyisoprenoid-binding protein YceI